MTMTWNQPRQLPAKALRALLWAVVVTAVLVVIAAHCAHASVSILPEHAQKTWLLAPYIWAPSLRGSTTFGGTNVPVDVAATDLAGGINAAAMGYGRWNSGANFVYVEGLGIRFHDDHFKPFFNQSLRTDVITAEVGYGRSYCLKWNADSPCLSLQPYVGVRYAQLDVEVGNPMGSQSANEHWLDPTLGLITTVPLGPVQFVTKLDAAGFGLGQDHYWNAMAVLNYPFLKQWSVAAGYRVAHFNAAPGGGNDLRLKLRAKGPIFNVAYRF